MKLLNVGGCNKHIAIPPHFDGWEHLLLDIDPNPEVDIVCDSREMVTNLVDQAGTFDAVYCSHNLEHYHRHDIPKVLAGFKMIIKDDGFVEIRVPNLAFLIQKMAREGLDIEDVIYESPAGPIKAVDMFYGMGAMIEHSGNDFMCHKTGFTPKSLTELLYSHGFHHIFMGASIEIVVYAFKNKPTDEQIKKLNVKHHPIGVTS